MAEDSGPIKRLKSWLGHVPSHPREEDEDGPLVDEVRRIDLHSDVRTDRLAGQIEALRVQLHAQADAIRALDRTLLSQVAEVRDVVRSLHDRIPLLRQLLLEMRATAAYARVWDDPEPFVSVRMATYNRARELAEVSVPSILAQTYDNFEVVIVGDGCTDDTAAVLDGFGDPKIRFVNLPHRSVYPPDPEHYWYVLGAPAMNHAVRLAAGTWIAPIDDDDEWTPDHLRVLVERAREGRCEMVYGRALQRWETTGEVKEIGKYPPECGEFTFHTALYLRMLDFFEYDTSSWVMREPGDWNMCRRMIEAGVRVGFTEDVLGTVHFEFKDHHYDLFGVPRPDSEDAAGTAGSGLGIPAPMNQREDVDT